LPRVESGGVPGRRRVACRAQPRRLTPQAGLAPVGQLAVVFVPSLVDREARVRREVGLEKLIHEPVPGPRVGGRLPRGRSAGAGQGEQREQEAENPHD
jgi:hypothetical protein